jgi:hypothetical protein
MSPLIVLLLTQPFKALQLQLDELDAASSVILVSVAIHWQGWSTEVVERHEELHLGAILGD